MLRHRIPELAERSEQVGTLARLMSRAKTLVSLALLLTALGALIAGCGGGSEKDAKAELQRGFNSSITSANVTVDITAQINGVPQLQQPIRVKLGGPYQSNGKGKLPSLNWDVSVSGGGQTFSAGLISTGDKGYVNFQGTNYQVDPATMQQLSQAMAQRGASGKKSLKDFGIDPIAWVKDPSVEGDSDVSGVATKHISATIDVKKLFEDLNKVVAKAGGAVGQAAPQQLTPQIIDQIAKVVHDPKFDAYVGKADGKFRRLALDLQFDVPENDQATLRGLKGGSLSISVEFANVGKPQTITAPANAKPLSELTKQLGGLGGALGGATGGIGGSGGTGGTGGPTGSSGASDKYQKYAQCLNKADPSDSAAISRCAQLLK